MPFEIRSDYPPYPACKTGACWVCNAGRRPMLDRYENIVEITNKETDDNQDGFYTGVFICESCVSEMARLVGFITATDAERALDLAAVATAEKDYLIEQVEALQDALTSLKRLETYAPPVALKPKKVSQCEYCERTFVHNGALGLHVRAAHKDVA